MTLFRRRRSETSSVAQPAQTAGMVRSCSDMASAIVMSSDTRLHVDTIEQSVVIAQPLSPNSSASGLQTVESGPARKRVDEGILSRWPSEGFSTIAQAAKVVSSVVKPVPWLGPAAELVASVLVLCQSVGKNRNEAKNLALRCTEFLDSINGMCASTMADSVGGMIEELESLLEEIEGEMQKWKNLKFFESLLNQERIRNDIMLFHNQIEGFYQRFMIVTQTSAIIWMERHEKKYEEDIAGLKALLASRENKQMLSDLCSLEMETSDNVKKILSILQRFAPDASCKDYRSIGFRENFTAICNAMSIEAHEDYLSRPAIATHGNGAFDIYRGFYAGIPCAIKVLRKVNHNEDNKRRFERQFRLWRDVYAKDRGTYILPLLGAICRTEPPCPEFCFVSSWMENGNLLNYVKVHQSVDRIRLIRGTAEGLQFLHTYDPPLLHGFLKCSNILVTDFGEPLLADFGLLRITEKDKFHVSSCPDSSASFRWIAPEMFRKRDAASELTVKADVFMFGMTILELMTQATPFSHIKSHPQVLIYRGNGGLPLRPQQEEVQARGLDDQLWCLLEKCWRVVPGERPSISEVLDMLPPLSN